MILALGLAYADDAPADSVVARPAHLAIVTAPAERAVDGRARLALQVAHAKNLPSFLPFKPRDPIPLEIAFDHVASLAKEVEERLAASRGLVQYAIAVIPPTEVVQASSRTWLRRRAAELECLIAGAACITEHLWSIKETFRESKDIIIVCDDDVTYEMLVDAMDASRERRTMVNGKAVFPSMFPAVVVSSLAK